MQTKNVNVAPLNNCLQEVPTGGQQSTVAPPLPPRIQLQTPVRQTPGEAEVEGYGPYKPVPPPKPLAAVPVCHSPPPYRMPPYPDPNIPGAAGSHPNLHTHSSKFPIEREVILSSTDKNSKIPILNEYAKRPKGAIAPDAPHIQLAWAEDKRSTGQMNCHPHEAPGPHHLYKAQPMALLDSSRNSEPSPIARSQDHHNGYASGPGQAGAVPRTPGAHSTPEGGGETSQTKPFSSRTYHTIKDIISSRFNKRSDKVEELSPQSQLRQHGVYLANTQGPSSAEIMRRNQEIQRQIKERKEAHDDGGFQEAAGWSYPSTSHHAVIEMETPRRPHPQTDLDRILPADFTPSMPHQSQRAAAQSMPMQPGDKYGRTPSGYYQDAVGYGVPEARKTVPDVKHVGMAEASRREDRYQHQLRPEHTGVYVTRNSADIHNKPKTPESRTPDFHRRPNNFSDNRTLSRSVERLDSGVREVNRREYTGENLECKSDKDQCVEKEDEDDEGGFKGGGGSDYEKLRSGAQSDSGRGSTVYSSGKAKTERNLDTSPEPNMGAGTGDAQWVDLVESELRHILDPKLPHNIANSTLSESISSMTPPLPPLSPGGSSEDCSPTYKHKSLPYNSKPEYSGKSRAGPSRAMWSARAGSKDKSAHHRLPPKPSAKLPSGLMCSSLEIDSMLDEDNNSSDEELSTTIDTADTRTIRKQLESLEGMYSEVLKLLGVKKQQGRYQPSDPRIHKRRLYGSMSSLPSSVSSRPIRDKRRHDQSERKKVKDIKGINKRFQRLESHVVTLARSVAHLSSEMRTQHLMIQEMEVIRGELAALRTQSNLANTWSSQRAFNRVNVEQSNSNPERVKKLTKFFGDEPPLLRLFLKKLGYEKYATLFENERVGLVELPYLTEERLHKLGIPLGPRLRIMQEAQLGFPVHENTLCIV